MELRPVNFAALGTGQGSLVNRQSGEYVNVGDQDAVYSRQPRDTNASTIVDQSVPDRYEVTAGDESAISKAARLRGTS